MSSETGTCLCILMIKGDLFFALIKTKWFRVFALIMQQKQLNKCNGIQVELQEPGGGGGARYIPGWGGAARPLIP